jgi:hypothetical protein
MRMLQIRCAKDFTSIGTSRREKALVIHARDDVLILPIAVLRADFGVEGLEARGEDDSGDADLFFLDRLGEVDGFVLADRFADAAFLLLQVETAFIDVGNEGNRLGEIDMNRLVLRYLLVVLIGVLDRAVFDARRAARALVFLDVSGFLGKTYREIARFPFYTFNLGVGEDLYVRVPADLDQLGCEYSHRAVVGRKGLVELGHMATDARRLLNKIDLEARSREVERGLNTADASTDDHDVAEIVLA